MDPIRPTCLAACLVACLLSGCGEPPQPVEPDRAAQGEARLKKLEDQFSLVMKENQALKIQLDALQRDLDQLRKVDGAAPVQARKPVAQTQAALPPSATGSVQAAIAASTPPMQPVAADAFPRIRQAADEQRLRAMLGAMAFRRPMDDIVKTLNDSRVAGFDGRPWDRNSVLAAIRRYNLQARPPQAPGVTVQPAPVSSTPAGVQPPAAETPAAPRRERDDGVR